MTDKHRFSAKEFSPTDDQEDEGNSIIENLLKTNTRVKPRLGGNDKTPNRDGSIELRNDKTVIGHIDVQVKPVDSVRKKQGRVCYQLDGSLVGYSQVAGVPFILICYDRAAERAYWKQITKALFDGTPDTQQSVTIEFSTEDEIADGSRYADEWLRLNEEHLKTMQIADFMRSTMQLLQDDPGRPFGSLLDSPDAMVELLKRIEHTTNEKYRTRLEEAQRLYRAVQIEAARQILSPLALEITKDASTAELRFNVYIWLGNCYYRLEKFEEAESCFREALTLDGKSHKAQANLAHILYVRNTQKDEALKLAKEAYSTMPDDEYVLATYLFCLSLNKEKALLEEVIKDRSSLIDKSGVAQLALAQIAKEEQDYQRASQLFKRAFELDPSNHHTQILFAESIYKWVRLVATKQLAQGIEVRLDEFDKDLDEAVLQLDGAITQLSETTDRAALYRAYDTRAVINMIRLRFDVALVDCEKMDAVIPDKEFSKIVKAQIYTQTERFDEVIVLLLPLAGAERRDVLQALAYSYYRTNKYPEASKYFSRYVDEDQDSDSEVRAFAQCLWFSGNKKRAYQVARNLRKSGRAPIEIMREIELARLLEIEDWASALEVLEELIKADRDNAEHWIQRVAMYMNLRNRLEAVKFYGELPSELIESDEWARQQLQNLENGLNKLHWL
jgi:tetratricopeptide (TPR) repeat protein